MQIIVQINSSIALSNLDERSQTVNHHIPLVADVNSNISHTRPPSVEEINSALAIGLAGLETSQQNNRDLITLATIANQDSQEQLNLAQQADQSGLTQQATQQVSKRTHIQGENNNSDENQFTKLFKLIETGTNETNSQLAQLNSSFLVLNSKIQDNTNEIVDIKSRLSNLENRANNGQLLKTVAAVTDEQGAAGGVALPSSNQITSNSQQTDPNAVAFEVQAILRRANNLVVFNLPEQQDSDLSDIHSRDEVMRIIKNRRQLPASLSGSTNRTPAQRSNLRNLRTQAAAHNAHHPEDEHLIVKHINGVPRLVKKSVQRGGKNLQKKTTKRPSQWNLHLLSEC